MAYVRVAGKGGGVPASRALLAVEDDALLLTLRFWELSQPACVSSFASLNSLLCCFLSSAPSKVTEPLGTTGAEPRAG